ncbi:hypothetical protein KQ945_15490 [Bacillus subtilis subsp. subtilis]|nr:hypothetical protein [Bacillus subtilis subsp. subtilis]
MDPQGYSLMRGGLVHRVLHASGLLAGQAHLSWWLAAALVVLSAGPLLLATTVAGTLWPAATGMALFGDAATLSRLLLALPLLVVAAPYADALLRTALRQLASAELVPARRRDRLDALLQRVRRGRDGWLPELLCVLLALAPLLVADHPVNLLPGIPDWRLHGGQLTAAGRWYEWVALPLFRLLALLWLWRLVLWSLLLCGLPRVGLRLHAEHPDGAGGLAFLGLAQERFAILSLAGGLILAGACINHTQWLGEPLYAQRHLLAGYVIGTTALLLAPLLVLMPTLMRAKRHAMFRFDALGNRAAAVFDRRWQGASLGIAAGDSNSDSLLDHGDASAYADFSGVYQGLAQMSVVPFNRWNVLWIALHALVPLLPLVLFAMSIDELVKKLVGILA